MTAQKDAPWLFRTYAGHSTAADSNKLFRGNLDKGQTGLSVAFDLPTQTGFAYGRLNQRHLVPPKVSQQMAEQHGAFEHAFSGGTPGANAVVRASDTP